MVKTYICRQTYRRMRLLGYPVNLRNWDPPERSLHEVGERRASCADACHPSKSIYRNHRSGSRARCHQIDDADPDQTGHRTPV